MAEQSNDNAKPAGPVRWAAREAGRQLNVRAASRKIEEIFAEELDTPAEKPQRAELVRVVAPTPGPSCLSRLGAGLGLAGVVAFTVAAAFGGLLDAGLDAVRPAAPYAVPTLPAEPETPVIRPSCEEPHSGCPQRGDAAEARWSR
jgi:hypothetical protein